MFSVRELLLTVIPWTKKVLVYARFTDNLVAPIGLSIDNSVVAKTFGPFQDCTSNQAIAYGELSKPEHRELITSSISEAKNLLSRFSGLSLEDLAIEIAVFTS
jgi:hypothetical protein